MIIRVWIHCHYERLYFSRWLRILCDLPVSETLNKEVPVAVLSTTDGDRRYINGDTLCTDIYIV